MEDLSSFVLNLDKSFHEATVAHKTQIASILSPYFAPFYSYVAQAENASGLDNALIMYLTFFVISYPLAFVHRNLPSGAPRHVYSLTLGLLFCFLMFQWQALNAVIVPIVALLIMYFAPRQQVQKITFVWSFGYLILCHIYRMIVSYGADWSLDFSTLQMMITLKVISVGFNYSDGIDLRTKDVEHKRLSIQELPSLDSYFGYLFFYPSVMSGPIFEYKDYLIWANANNVESSAREVGKKLLIVVVTGLIFHIMTPMFPVSYMIEPRLTLLGTFWRRMVMAWGATTFGRYKYYVAWALAEGAIVTAGLKSNGEWIKSVNIVKVEFGTNMRDLINNWNITVSKWMRNYVYTRAGKSSGRALVFVTTGLWHGLYPGYLLFSVFIGIATVLHQNLRRKQRPLIFRRSEDINDLKNENFVVVVLYRTVGWFVSHATFAYFGSSFQLLDLYTCLHWYEVMRWTGHAAMVVFFIFSLILPSPPRKKVE